MEVQSELSSRVAGCCFAALRRPKYKQAFPSLRDAGRRNRLESQHWGSQIKHACQEHAREPRFISSKRFRQNADCLPRHQVNRDKASTADIDVTNCLIAEGGQRLPTNLRFFARFGYNTPNELKRSIFRRAKS